MASPGRDRTRARGLDTTAMSPTILPITVPWLGEEEAEAARQVLLSGWVTQGPKTAAFEAAFQAYTGAGHACAVSSCTTALHLALASVGVRPGDVVATASHSFIATANAIRYCGAEPVFVDIDPATLNIDPMALERCLDEDFQPDQDGRLRYRHLRRLMAMDETPLRGQREPLGRLAAVLAVHQVGMPADLAALDRICRNRGVPLVEDAACALGSQYKSGQDEPWQAIGKPWGAAVCFSFHPRKVITTGDGGMICTDREDLDQSWRLLRQHGMSVSDRARHHSNVVVFEQYLTTGYNYRLTDIQAAVGLMQMKRLPAIVERRRHLAGLYDQALREVPGLTLPTEPSYARSNWQSYVVGLEDESQQVPVMQKMLDQGISTRRGVMCAHLEKPYQQAWPPASLPHSRRARDCGVIVPLFPTMQDQDVLRVSEALLKALDS